MTQTILDLNEREWKWLADNLAAMKELVESIVGADQSDWLQLANLDAAYSSWHTTHKHGAEDPNPFINAFGIAFGQSLVNELQLECKLVQDEHGTELALHGTPGEILLFPTNLVAKRYEKAQTGFFSSLSAEIIEQVKRIRSGSA